MRSLPKNLAGVAVTLGLIGCTFIATFEEPLEDTNATTGGRDSGKADRVVPGDDDDITSSSSSSSSSASSSSSGAVPTFPPVCEPKDIDCTGKTRPSCGSEFTTLPEGVAASDLVDCTTGTPTCVRRCPNGCVAMPGGTNDQCDPCAGKPDGIYCERDLAGFPTDEQAGLQFYGECSGGKYKRGSGDCGDGTPGICQSECKRIDPPPVFPSCCTTK